MRNGKNKRQEERRRDPSCGVRYLGDDPWAEPRGNDIPSFRIGHRRSPRPRRPGLGRNITISCEFVIELGKTP